MKYQSLTITRVARGLALAGMTVLLASPAGLDAAWVRSKYGTIVYSVFVPKTYSASQKYPVVMVLHGAGERGNNYVNESNQDAQILASDTNQAKRPCFVFTPQCPTNDQYVNTPWGSSAGSYSTTTIPESNSLRDAMKVLDDSICATYSVDINRIYVGGGSMGGFGTWDVLVRHSSKWAAAIVLSGGGDTSKAGNFATTVPVWGFVCDADYVVLPVQMNQMIAAVKRHGGSPLFNHYANAAALNKNGYVYYDTHMWILPFQLEPTSLTWLFSQSRAASGIKPCEPLKIASRASPGVYAFVSVAGSGTGGMRIRLIDERAVAQKVFDVQGNLVEMLRPGR